MDDPIVEASPLCSEIYYFFGLLVISGLVLLLIRYYLPLRSTPAYLLLPIFLALALPASLILLVPIDLASIASGVQREENRGVWLPKRIILISWRILYWETFFLTWFILPILAEYADAGYRDPKSRLIWSLKRNLVYQAVIIGSGLAVMIYFFVSVGVSPITLKGLLVATAYFWSLLFAIYLMGHGLVAIPRRLFRSANLEGRLKYLYAHASEVDEKLTNAKHEVEDLEDNINELARKKKEFGTIFQDWIEELNEESHMISTRTRHLNRRNSNLELAIPAVMSAEYLADLSRTLSRARHARAQYLGEWDQVRKSAREIKETLEAYSSGRNKIGKSSLDVSVWKRFTTLTPSMRFHYRYYLLPSVKKLLGFIFSLASFFIIWSELIKPVNPLFSIIAVTIIHHPNAENGEIGFLGQIIAASWILYMCLAALTSLTEVKVWRGRALVRRNTHGESAVWYSYQVARLSVPLAFNFMTFLDPDIYKRTVFYEFLGKLINLTPLSSWFDMLWPTLIIVPVCATLFGLYGKINNCIGYGEFIIDDEDSNGMASFYSGRDLIEREQYSSSPASVEQNSYTILRHEGISESNFSNEAPSHNASGRMQNSSRFGLPRSGADNHQNHDRLLENNSYQDFWHRLRNTASTIPTPKWLQSARDGMRIPKWINGNNQAAANNNVDYLFRRGEGRLRI